MIGSKGWVHLSLGPKRLGGGERGGWVGGVGGFPPALLALPLPFLFFLGVELLLLFSGGWGRGVFPPFLDPLLSGRDTVRGEGTFFSGTPFWGRSGGASPGCTINNQLRTGTDKGNPTV